MAISLQKKATCGRCLKCLLYTQAHVSDTEKDAWIEFPYIAWDKSQLINALKFFQAGILTAYQIVIAISVKYWS